MFEDLVSGIKNGVLIAEKKRLLNDIKEKQKRIKEIDKILGVL